MSRRGERSIWTVSLVLDGLVDTRRAYVQRVDAAQHFREAINDVRLRGYRIRGMGRARDVVDRHGNPRGVLSMSRQPTARWLAWAAEIGRIAGRVASVSRGDTEEKTIALLLAVLDLLAGAMLGDPIAPLINQVHRAEKATPAPLRQHLHAEESP